MRVRLLVPALMVGYHSFNLIYESNARRHFIDCAIRQLARECYTTLLVVS